MGRPGGPHAGKHTIVFGFKYDEPGFGKGGTGVLSVDGKDVDRKKMPATIPFIVSFEESTQRRSRHPPRGG